MSNFLSSSGNFFSEFFGDADMHQMVLFGIKAIVILLTGILFSYIAKKYARRFLFRTLKDEILINFLSQVIFTILIVITAVSTLGALGVQTASIIAVLGAAGLAIGLALKDSLGSLASGIILIILRPFKKGDLVDIGSVYGMVEAINLFNTTIRLPDNKIAIIPNSATLSGTIVNHTNEENRRIEWICGVSYDSNIENTRKIVLREISTMDKILKEPEPFVGVVELGESSIQFSIRVWINCDENFFLIRSELIEKIKVAFDLAGIEIPYNKLDVYMR